VEYIYGDLYSLLRYLYGLLYNRLHIASNQTAAIYLQQESLTERFDLKSIIITA
jgi:hypothetical protein